MEDTRDSQDSETSSTSSWILLGNDEDSESRVQENLLKEALQSCSDTDSKNSHSDLESDGISIISEGEFPQSFDEIAYDSKNEEDISNEYISKEQDLDVDDSSEIIKKDHFEQELEDETVDAVPESENIIEDRENSENELACESTMVIGKSSLKMAISDNSVQSYDYRKMLTWPSIICTSVLIFAVVVFPYFSSKIDNNLDHSNMEAHDVYSMSEKELTDVDVWAYCRELHKVNGRYQDSDMKKCIKKWLKLIKKAKKNQLSKEVEFLDITTDNEIMENLGSLRKNKKFQDKRNKKDKSFRKIETKLNEDERLKDQNAEVTFRNEDGSDDNWTYSVEKKIANNKNISQKKKKSENVDKYNNFVEKEAVLTKREKILMEKEKHLKEWEFKLMEKEANIKKMQQEKDNHDRKNCIRNKSNEESSEKRRLKNGKEHENKYSKNDFQKSRNESLYQKSSFKNNEKKPNKRKSHKQEYTKNNSIPPYKKRKNAKKFEDEYVSSNFEGNSSEYFKVQNNQNRENRSQVLEDDNVTMTGDWYLNLVQARQDLRKREEKALWWFDRVDYRKNKRNKAFWYFQYMFNRENLRYRPKHI